VLSAGREHTLLEDPTPTVLSLMATERYVFDYGLKAGRWFWKRTPHAWDEIKKMDQRLETETAHPSELISALKEQYHYYIIGCALPEDFTPLGCGVYLNDDECTGIVKGRRSVFGGSGGRHDGFSGRGREDVSFIITFLLSKKTG